MTKTEALERLLAAGDALALKAESVIVDPDWKRAEFWDAYNAYRAAAREVRAMEEKRDDA